MGDIWADLTGGKAHTGSWGLPDFGLTEEAAKRIGRPANDLVPDDIQRTAGAVAKVVAPVTNLLPGMTNPQGNGQTLGAVVNNSNNNNNNSGGNNNGGNTQPQQNSGGPGGWNWQSGNRSEAAGGHNVGDVVNGFRWDGTKWDYIGTEDSRRQQEEAARKAYEARRQAALNKYNVAKQAGENAKTQAKGQYDWLVDTYGSNKKDLLDQVALNEQTTIEGYAQNETKTKQQYDKARQEILTTYRDLNRQQEKILRGSGMSTSSRSMEAQMRLNNLMGKDISQVSTNEADAVAMIGNAITQVKKETALTRNSIETESKSKLDKAALDYKTQIDNINTNMMLSENEREEAYMEAEAKLADDTAKVNAWAAQVKTQFEFQQRELQSKLDAMVLSMTDQKGLLSAGLNEKMTATQQFVNEAGFKVNLDTETDMANTSPGSFRTPTKTYKSKEELDQALQSGALSELAYNQQLGALQRGGSTGGLSLASTNVAPYTQRVQNDPLLSALLGGNQRMTFA